MIKKKKKKKSRSPLSSNSRVICTSSFSLLPHTDSFLEISKDLRLLACAASAFVSVCWLLRTSSAHIFSFRFWGTLCLLLVALLVAIATNHNHNDHSHHKHFNHLLATNQPTIGKSIQYDTTTAAAALTCVYSSTTYCCCCCTLRVYLARSRIQHERYTCSININSSSVVVRTGFSTYHQSSMILGIIYMLYARLFERARNKRIKKLRKTTHCCCCGKKRYSEEHLFSDLYISHLSRGDCLCVGKIMCTACIIAVV